MINIKGKGQTGRDEWFERTGRSECGQIGWETDEEEDKQRQMLTEMLHVKVGWLYCWGEEVQLGS